MASGTVAVLMAVYDAVDPRHLREALESVRQQTRRPDQVVVVGDGPLTPAQETVLADFADDPGFTRVSLELRRGAGPARQAGLAHVTTTWVAIADADDVCLPHRLETQLGRLEQGDVDVLGAAVEEFDAETSRTLGVRRFPLDHEAVARRMRSVNPVNQPAVVVRREALVAAGGYRDVPMLEDYELWVRMLGAGARFANLEEVLVRFRGGRAVQGRRTSWTALRSEWEVQRQLRATGRVGAARAVLGWVLRTGYRLLPAPVVRVAYRRLFLGGRATGGSSSPAPRADRPAYDVYVDMRESRAPLADRLAEQALRTAGFSAEDEPGLDVLDVGSGYGDTALNLAARGARVVGLEPAGDLHAHAVAAAAAAGSDARFVLSGIEDYQPPADGFDLVILDNVLEHLPDHAAALEAVSRCLRDGGRLYLLVPNRTWPWEAHYHLPFLAWLPLPLANRYLRLSGRGHDYTDASYAPTYRGLKRALARQGDLDAQFRLPAVAGATIAGAPLHYRVGIALISRVPALWSVSKALLVVATKRPAGSGEGQSSPRENADSRSWRE